jgi:hypothetical protein
MREKIKENIHHSSKKYFGKLYLELLNIVFDEMFNFSYSFLILYLKMSSITTIMPMLEILGFSSATATYLTGTCGTNSLEDCLLGWHCRRGYNHQMSHESWRDGDDRNKNNSGYFT